MNEQWPIIPLSPKIIPSSQPHLHRISRPSNPPASTCCLLRRTVALVMLTCYAASASALVRIAWRSSCGPPTGGALGSCRRRPAARATTTPVTRFDFWCAEASVVALLPVARWGPPAARPCRYASVTTSERRAWSLRPCPCFCRAVPLCQLAWRSPARLCLHHGGSVGGAHRSAASMWQQHAGSDDHANGKLNIFSLFNSGSYSEMLYIA